MLLLRTLRGLRPIEQSLCRPLFRGLRGPLLLHPAHRGQHRGHHVLHVARIAPVEPEQLRKDPPVLGPVHETGMQRPVEIPLLGEPRRLNRPDRVNHPPRTNRQPRTPQRTGEMGDVPCQFRVIWQFKRKIFSHGWLIGGSASKPPEYFWLKRGSCDFKRGVGLIQCQRLTALEPANQLYLPDDPSVEMLKFFCGHPKLLMVTPSGLLDWIALRQFCGDFELRHEPQVVGRWQNRVPIPRNFLGIGPCRHWIEDWLIRQAGRPIRPAAVANKDQFLQACRTIQDHATSKLALA